eukprot:4566576-Amphidinium_carterae.1
MVHAKVTLKCGVILVLTARVTVDQSEEVDQAQRVCLKRKTASSPWPPPPSLAVSVVAALRPTPRYVDVSERESQFTNPTLNVLKLHESASNAAAINYDSM